MVSLRQLIMSRSWTWIRLRTWHLAEKDLPLSQSVTKLKPILIVRNCVQECCAVMDYDWSVLIINLFMVPQISEPSWASKRLCSKLLSAELSLNSTEVQFNPTATYFGINTSTYRSLRISNLSLNSTEHQFEFVKTEKGTILLLKKLSIQK